MDRDVLLKCLARGKNLLEANAAFFVKKVDPVRREKGKSLQHYFVGVDRDSSGNAVIEFSVPSQRDQNKRYRCFIDIIPKGPNLFALAQTTKKLADKVNILKNADVKCFCSCPDFNWSGMKYNMKHVHDSLASGHHSDNAEDDHGEDINPKIRDPKHKNTLCKHLVAALRGVLTNAPSIMKQVREMPRDEKTTEPVVNEPNPIVGKKDSEEQSANSKDRLDKENGVEDTVKEEAIESFDNTASIKTEETQQALDALADHIEPGSQPSEDVVEDPGAGMIGKYNDESQEPSKLFAYDDELGKDSYDMMVEEEPEESVDDDYVVGGPIELPKP